MPAADPTLVAALAEAVRAQAGAVGGTVAAEWSQAASDHAGRIYTPAGRLPLGDAAVTQFARLREQQSTPETGAWLSARIDVPARGAPAFTANYDRRPWWNTPGDSMLEAAPGAAPYPSDQQWLTDLERHPRPRDRWPDWLEWVDPTAEYARLRAELDRVGVPRGAVRLPGETHPYFEGAILVRSLGRSLATAELTDYGQSVRLGDGAPAQVCAGVWHYLTSPLPEPVPLPVADATARAQAAVPALRSLAARVRAAGPGGIATDLAPGILFDRIGTLDGLYFFGWQTPLPQRSLPPTATAEGAATITFLSRIAVPVQAEVTPAWFGRPGGALRFRALDERVSVRDLVRSGALVPVRVM